MFQFKPRFEIGQDIYHVTPESQSGVIIDISYLVSTREIKYLVAIDFDKEVWSLERELSNTRRIV